MVVLGTEKVMTVDGCIMNLEEWSTLKILMIDMIIQTGS